MINLKIGDPVLILKNKKNYKFDTPYQGPYIIEKVLSPVTIIVKKGHKSMKVHINRVKKSNFNITNK